MAMLNAGDEIACTITYLEMLRRPTAPVPPMPMAGRLALLAARTPPPDYFLYLYRTVGAEYEWTDWLSRSVSDVEGFVHDPDVTLFTMILDGWPGGFFMLDWREGRTCDLAYFGLTPGAVGRGLGRWLLATAIDTGWSRNDVVRMTVNTNTLDHPRALGLYQRAGFAPYRREDTTRILSAPRDGSS